ncbi:MAG: hypothetical protein IIC22_06645 [Chloroflexi bacterium]|nr:hypothetical protein [Chloroflexota bacterium]
MTLSKKRFVVDDEGNRVGVLLDIAEYQEILDELEELESIRAYDAAKMEIDESIPIDQALKEIEQERR